MPGSEPLDWGGYCARWSAAHGGYDPRRAPAPVRVWLRLNHRLGTVLVRAGVRSPDAVTAAGLLLSLAVPVAAGAGIEVLAAVLVLLSAFADTLDGVLAIIAGRATRLGQVYDSVADRVAEAAWLTAFVLLGAPVWLAAATGGVMWLHEYVRARAAVAGMGDIGTVTIAERPTRVLLTIAGLLAVHTGVLAVALAVSVVGFVQLAVAVRRALR